MAGLRAGQPTGMYPQVMAQMATQHGLVTRRQALDAGLSEEHVDRLVRAGTWVAVRRGVYAEAAFVEQEQAAGWARRQRLSDRAASLRMRRPHVMSHNSAAHELGLAVLRPPNPTTHVTRPGLVGSHRRYDVAHHLAPYGEEQVVVLDGRRVLDAARTAADVAREHPLEHGVVAFDSARRLGVGSLALAAAVDPTMRCWPQVTRVRQALELSVDGSDSPGETLARLLVCELGMGVPEVQFGLTDGRRTVWCDLRLGRHVIEFDGRVKYRPADEGGLAREPAEDVVWREKQRQDWITGFKLGMSRLVWHDVRGAGRAAALVRLRREVQDTEARFGTSIDDLAAYVVPGPRPAHLRAA